MRPLYEIYDGYRNVPRGERGLFGIRKESNRDAYQKTMKEFRNLYEEDIIRVCAEAAAAESPASYLAAYGQQFMDEVERILTGPGKQKPARAVKYDSTFFTVMYVIPLIRLCEPENRDALAEALRAAWENRFGEQIRLSSYQEIYQAFTTRFGLK